MKASTIFNLANFVSVKYQIILIILNAFLSAFIVMRPLSTFISTDPVPVVQPYSTEATKKLGITSRIVEVQTGLSLENFYEFDFASNKFVVNAIVWFKFDPALVSLDTIGKFSFEKGIIENISKPDTKFVGRLLFARYTIKLRFTSNLDHRFYPVNDHQLFIVLLNRAVSPKEVIFTSSETNFTLSPNIELTGGTTVKKGVKTGYLESVLDKYNPQLTVYYPAVVFSLNLKTSGLRHIFLLVFPLFCILYIAFLTISLSTPDLLKTKLALSAANISALIAYRFVIEKMAPVTSYFILSDHIFNLVLFIIIFIFIFNVASLVKFSYAVAGGVVIGLHLFFIGSWMYLLRYWVRA